MNLNNALLLYQTCGPCQSVDGDSSATRYATHMVHMHLTPTELRAFHGVGGTEGIQGYIYWKGHRRKAVTPGRGPSMSEDKIRICILLQLLKRAELFVTDSDLREKIREALWLMDFPPEKGVMPRDQLFSRFEDTKV